MRGVSTRESLLYISQLLQQWHQLSNQDPGDDMHTCDSVGVDRQGHCLQLKEHRHLDSPPLEVDSHLLKHHTWWRVSPPVHHLKEGSGCRHYLFLYLSTSNVWEPLKHLQAGALEHLAKEVWSIQWQVTPASETMLYCCPAGCCGSYMIDRAKLF